MALRSLSRSATFATSLALVLLAAATLSLGAHEHLGAGRHEAEVACVADHGSAHPPVTQPTTHEAGKRHRHECFGCHVSFKKAGLTLVGLGTLPPDAPPRGLGPLAQHGCGRDQHSLLGARAPPLA
jgi:hypothetical protein